jgi:hypothetical protein
MLWATQALHFVLLYRKEFGVILNPSSILLLPSQRQSPQKVLAALYTSTGMLLSL